MAEKSIVKGKNISFKRIKRELAYSAHIFDVYNDYLELPDGRRVIYDYIDHADGACILPVLSDGTILLVKQYRNTLDMETYEAPAGCLNAGETGEQAAIRELLEETGYKAEKLQFLTKTILAIGTSNEQTYIYLGYDLSEGTACPDDDEFINTYRFSMEQAIEMIENGSIVDSKTIIAIFGCKALSEK